MIRVRLFVLVLFVVFFDRGQRRRRACGRAGLVGGVGAQDEPRGRARGMLCPLEQRLVEEAAHAEGAEQKRLEEEAAKAAADAAEFQCLHEEAGRKSNEDVAEHKRC